MDDGIDAVTEAEKLGEIIAILQSPDPLTCVRKSYRYLTRAFLSQRHENTKHELGVWQIRRTILGMGLFSFYIEPLTRAFVASCEN